MNILRAFALPRVKIIVNFNIRTYIYFYKYFLKTPTSKIEEFIIKDYPFIVSHMLVE